MLAIGLMSGTSMDGIDVALIETDGEAHVRPLAFQAVPYDEAMRGQLRRAMQAAMEQGRPGPHPVIDAAADAVTRMHVAAVRDLFATQPALRPVDVAVVGFHGQTVAHRPDRGWTWQIGDGARMARDLGMTVVDDFRSADVAAGGQGAPLVPVYHQARAAALAKPLMVLNLGGVGNLSYVGEDGTLVAFDTGPGNSLIDDWMQAHAGLSHDEGGATAAAGAVDEVALAGLLDNDWFDAPPPKSLDRNHFAIALVSGLSLADGAATLAAFTAASIVRGIAHLPAPPCRILVAGGGRHNAVLMTMLAERSGLPVAPVEAVGWAGDATEAEAFAYLAVRRLKGLPISFPLTTGVATPVVGGRVHRPAS